MGKKLACAFGLVLVWALSVQAQESAPSQRVTVAVAPFAIHTAEPQPQLSGGVQELLAQSLLNLGVELVPLPDVRRVTARTAATNAASRRVLEKLSFEEVGRAWDMEDGELILWARPR